MNFNLIMQTKIEKEMLNSFMKGEEQYIKIKFYIIHSSIELNVIKD